MAGADPQNDGATTALGSGGPSDPDPVAARAGLNLRNLAHGLKLVALLLFLLPWVTVSCAEQTLVSMSGMDMATGSVQVKNPLTGEVTSPPDEGDGELPILLAALAIAVTLIAGFVLRRSLARAVSIAGLAAAGLLISYSVLYRLPERARENALADSAQGISEAQLAELIRVEIAPGFWLTLGAIVAAIVSTYLAERKAPPGPP